MPQQLVGSPESPGRLDAHTLAARALLALADGMSIPSLRAAATIDGEIAWVFAHDGPARAPSGGGESFLVGSLSKSFTGTLAARLHDMGALSLDRPVMEMDVRAPAQFASLTLREILNFTSGIGGYAGPEERFDATPRRSARELLDVFGARPLAHPPGRGYLYSSFAYVYAAVVMESATGLEFTRLVRDELLNPLAMHGTFLLDPLDPDPRCAARLERGADGRVGPAPRVDYYARAASSGYASSVPDLLRFAHAHFEPGFLTHESLDALGKRPDPAPGGLGSPWGLGWRRRIDWEGRTVLFGEGQTVGCNACLLVYPAQRAALALLSNVGGYPLQRVGVQPLMDALLGERAGSLAPFPDEFAGRWLLRDAGDGTHLGRAEIVPGAGVEGTVALESMPASTIAAGFGIGRDGWLLCTRSDVGLRSLRARAGRRGVEMLLPGEGKVALAERE